MDLDYNEVPNSCQTMGMQHEMRACSMLLSGGFTMFIVCCGPIHLSHLTTASASYSKRYGYLNLGFQATAYKCACMSSVH